MSLRLHCNDNDELVAGDCAAMGCEHRDTMKQVATVLGTAG
jgi:hypothetical protein